MTKTEQQRQQPKSAPSDFERLLAKEQTRENTEDEGIALAPVRQSVPLLAWLLIGGVLGALLLIWIGQGSTLFTAVAAVVVLWWLAAMERKRQSRRQGKVVRVTQVEWEERD